MEKKYETQIKFFGLRIKELRAESHLTQTELAKKVGVGERTIQRIEVGEISIGLDVIIALAVVFGIEPSDLLSDIMADDERNEIIKKIKNDFD